MTQLQPVASEPVAGIGDAVFANYVADCLRVLASDEPQRAIATLTERLIARWRMPDARYLQVRPDSPYASYLLYLSEAENLSIVLDIFMPGQAAVIHNHLCWCVFGCLQGVEKETVFDAAQDLSSPPRERDVLLRHPGDITIAGSAVNDLHQVECHSETVSISLHVYGANIGAITRQMWQAQHQRYEEFTGGYSNNDFGLPPYVTNLALQAFVQDQRPDI